MDNAQSYTENFLQGPSSNPPVTFYTRAYAPPLPAKPTAAIVHVHGFLEHSGRYTRPHSRWAAAGFGVFSYDQRGFGLTALEKDGKHKKGPGVSLYGHANDAEQIRDALWAIERAEEIWPGVPIYLMGHSMGGALVLAALTRPGTQELFTPKIRGVIASSPCIALTHPPSSVLRRAGGFASKLAPNLSLNAPVDGSALSHDAAIGEAFKADPLVQAKVTAGVVDAMLSRGEELANKRKISWPSSLPLLVVHGDKDEVCSIHATRKYYEKVKADDRTLSVYPGGFHELHNEPDGVAEKFTDELIAWVKAHVDSPQAPAFERTSSRL